MLSPPRLLEVFHPLSCSQSTKTVAEQLWEWRGQKPAGRGRLGQLGLGTSWSKCSLTTQFRDFCNKSRLCGSSLPRGTSGRLDSSCALPYLAFVPKPAAVCTYGTNLEPSQKPCSLVLFPTTLLARSRLSLQSIPTVFLHILSSPFYQILGFFSSRSCFYGRCPSTGFLTPGPQCIHRPITDLFPQPRAPLIVKCSMKRQVLPRHCLEWACGHLPLKRRSLVQGITLACQAQQFVPWRERSGQRVQGSVCQEPERWSLIFQRLHL